MHPCCFVAALGMSEVVLLFPLLAAADEELELWAGAMGHCDYGTAADAGLVHF